MINYAKLLQFKYCTYSAVQFKNHFEVCILEKTGCYAPFVFKNLPVFLVKIPIR